MSSGACSTFTSQSLDVTEDGNWTWDDLTREKTLTFTAIKIPHYQPEETDVTGETGNAVIQELAVMKTTLIKAKGVFDFLFAKGKEETMIVNKMMKVEDPFSAIPRSIAAEFGAQCVSNSFMKFYEMFDGLGIGKQARVFFNAELPGGALAAWNHYNSVKKFGECDWRASSLLPNKKNGAFDDIYGLMAGNKDKWLMGGQWGDGDATKLENIDRWVEAVGPVNLYAHDAGMDASSDYNNQEKINSLLHLGCNLTGLRMLERGGVFIGKQYTCLEPFTISMILGLSSVFDKLYLVKPMTSRERNSETYVVGIGYFGAGHPTASTLIAEMTRNLKSRQDQSPPLMGINWESLSVKALASFNKTVIDKQVQSIERFFSSYKTYGGSWNGLNQYSALMQAKHERVKQHWVRENHFLVMDKSKHLKQIQKADPHPQFHK